jgi:hypothetical protein
MSTLPADLAALLGTVRRPGDFFASGSVDLLAPLVEVEGVGPIALPLLPAQGRQLIAVAEQAPYGRGEATLVDLAVRRTWQIEAGRVRIRGKHWAGTLETIVGKVADGLGVTGPVAAEFYKMLVYDEGSFFVGHRDTEKAPGMFATLVIVLPSLYVGGGLVVRHKGREMQFDLHGDDPSEVRFAAFYADCIHQVLPVTEGCRLTLIYNLVRPVRTQEPRPEPPDYEDEQAGVAALLQDWVDGPEKLIYPLEHAYTQAELGFGTLKGADAAVAGVLVAAAARADCDLHLALLSIEERGSAEYTGDYRSRRRRWSDESEDDDDDAADFTAGEVCDRNVVLTDWRRPDGSAPVMATVPVEEDELSPPDALEGLEPDEEEFEEATGNAGASFERTYRRASLVLWPHNRFFAVLNQAGLSATLPYLADLADRWSASGRDREDPLWRQADELSGHMLSDWPGQPWYSEIEAVPGATARMLGALTRLGAADRIEALFDRIAARGGTAKDNNAVMADALARLTRERQLAVIERLFAATAATSLGACVNLLLRVVTASPPALVADLAGAATLLIEALPGDQAPPVAAWPGQRPSPVDPDLVVDLVIALVALDASLAGLAVDRLLAAPNSFGFDAVLVPAASVLIGVPGPSRAPAFERLRTACLNHLRARIALPLEPPKDWRRRHDLPCACADCTDLSRFLADPADQRWVFKAATPRREHLERTIRTARCDVDTVTTTQGRPYSLVCTKNQASYQRQVTQRARDRVDLKQLEGGD